MLRLFSWNVNGFRAVTGKDNPFGVFLEAAVPDVLCLQEIKLNPQTVPVAPADDLFAANPYPQFPHQFWHLAEKPGYSGVAILSKVKPLAVSRDFTLPGTGEATAGGAAGAAGAAAGAHPREGRVLTAEFGGCFVVCAYVPNAQQGLVRLDYRLRWDADFRAHLGVLAARKPVFVCGDLNVAHNEIDLENPKANRKNAGFSDEERASFSELLASGFADTFRVKNPDAVRRYSWWSYRSAARERNIGWRIDYWLASTAPAAHALDGHWCKPEIHDGFLGSDHCPVSVEADAELF